MNIKELFEKHRDVIPYLFFGVCTTLVNLAAYWVAAHLLEWRVVPSTIFAWVLAVLFAYLTNRTWVFHSKAEAAGETAKEMIRFFSCRLATGIIDWLCMFLLVDILTWNDMAVKFFSNALVIILNYVASKLVVFRKEARSKNQP